MNDNSSQWKQDAAVIDLDGMDMEVIHNDEPPGGSTTAHFTAHETDQSSKGPLDDVRQRLQDNMTQMIWDKGKQNAKKAWNIYGNIDILRPYFNVEPYEVRDRMLFSLIPQIPKAEKQRVPRELYGPMMVIFTLIALLLFQMKSSDHRVEEGTLMGTAFGVCYTYWLGASGFLWFLSYVCNCHMSLVQILSMMGYGLTGHCIVIFLGTVLHTSHDHLFFYLLWTILGGLSTLRMVSIILSRTQGQTQKMILCCALTAFHLLFLLYLHFAYHQIVEEISDMLLPKPVLLVNEDDVVNKKIEEDVKNMGNV